MLMTPGPEGGVMRLKDDVFVGLDGDASVGMTIFSPTLRDERDVYKRQVQRFKRLCTVQKVESERGICTRNRA